MCVPNINPSMASTTCILSSAPTSTTAAAAAAAASRARHFSAPANFVKPTTISISTSPKLLISSSCRMQRSCRLRPKSKEVGDSPSDSSAITATRVLESSNESTSRTNHHLEQPYNPASTTMVQCQITCRPTPSVISREKRIKKSVSALNYFMSEPEEKACCWNIYNNIDLKTPFNSNKNKFPKFHPHHPFFNPNVSSPITQTTTNHYHHSTSDGDDRNVRLKKNSNFREIDFRNNNGNGNSCLWNDSSGVGGAGREINFVNPEDHSWNSGFDNNFLSTTSSPPLVSKFKSKKSCQNQNIISSSSRKSTTTTTTTAILSYLDPRNTTNSRSSVISRENNNSSRSWLLLCFSLTLLLSLCVESSEATKICHSMNIAGVKGDVMKKFENLTDCTIIEGHLIVASFQEKDNFTLTFPNLREVTEYVVFYEAQNIVKLDQMFPNLAVIRGNKLLSDFALIIYKMERMVEIGLKGLTHILNGGVRIQRNRDLCYVKTIDWKKIVSKKYHQNIVIEANQYEQYCPQLCPEDCKNKEQLLDDKCWNKNNCQKDPNNLKSPDEKDCDQQCIGGCTTGNDRNYCFACKNVMYEFSQNNNNQTKFCIDKCPDKFLLHGNWRCVDENKCKQFKSRVNTESIGEERPYKVYDGKCLKVCPADTEEFVDPVKHYHTCKECADCSKECPGKTIRTLESLRDFEGCTKISGDLTIQISGKNVVDELENNLGRVTTITGSLKISRSFPIVSLDFFKKLVEIQGVRPAESEAKWDELKDSHYSLEILENENLQKLFPDGSNVTITQRNGPKGTPEKGRASIHYNKLLCRQEIKNLIERSKLYDPEEHEGSISYGTNGQENVCSQKTLNLTIAVVPGPGDPVLQISFTNYMQEIVEVHDKDHRVLLGYEINYREIDAGIYHARNLTKFAGRDACGHDEWTITDHTDFSVPVIDPNGVPPTWHEETTIITDGIKPFSYYAVFVTTLIIRDKAYKSENIQNAASKIEYYQTPEGKPDTPEDINVKLIDYSKVNITWTAPARPNGIIENYVIEIEHHDIDKDRLISNHIKCEDSSTSIKNIGADNINDNSGNNQNPVKPPNNNNNKIDPNGGTCDCNSCPKDGSKMAPINKEKLEREKTKMEENSFVNDLLNEVYKTDFNSPSLFSISSISRKKRSLTGSSQNTKFDNATTANNEIPENFVKSKPYDEMTDKEIQDEETALTTIVFKGTVQGNKTFIEIGNLTHFSKYTLTIKACHKSLNESDWNALPYMAKASYDENHRARCSKIQSSDFLTAKKEGADDIPSESVTTNSDSNNGTKVWVTWNDPPNPNLAIIYYNIQYKLPNTDKPMEICLSAFDFEKDGRKFEPAISGSYHLRIAAVSLAGPGKFTKEISITKGDNLRTPLVGILLPIFGCILILMVVGIVAYYYYMKHRGGSDWTTPNPLYMKRNFGEFEIPRDLIDRGEKLGSGSFGTVYSGIYHSPNDGDIECAIKEAKNEELGDNMREKLLDEAYIMRTIETSHVVRLIGVVTNQFPQYVILEFMEKGDLKRYLMGLRKKPPRQADILLMALQVADGMAYLSTVPNPKIVHRDLAARNCMVNANLVVKIGDFGLARDLDYAEDYYRMRGRDRMPIRWMAPESIRDNMFTTSSDIWAYGMVLWEMVTLGEQPYQGLSNEEVVQCVRNGETNGTPRNCPEQIGSLMETCWRFDPDNRPNFLNICDELIEYANDEFRRESFFTSPLCNRILGRNAEEVPLDESSERAPLRPNGSSNGNGEARLLDNGFAVVPATESMTMQDFNSPSEHAGIGLMSGTMNSNPRQYNMLDRFMKILRNRYRSNNPTATTTTAATSEQPKSAAVEA